MENILIIYEHTDMEHRPLCYEVLKKPEHISLKELLYNYSVVNEVTIADAFTVTDEHIVSNTDHMWKFDVETKKL